MADQPTGRRHFERPLDFFEGEATRTTADVEPGSISQARVDPGSIPSTAATASGTVVRTDADAVTARDTFDMNSRGMADLDCPLWLKDFALWIDQCGGQSLKGASGNGIGQCIGQSSPVARDPRAMPASSREPWALTPEERARCAERKRGLCHRIRIRGPNEVRISSVRDTTVAESDDQVKRGVEFGTVPKNGRLTHIVYTRRGPKKVRENLETGALTISGRPRSGPMGMLWDPAPHVLTFLRLCNPPRAELVRRPDVPVHPTDVRTLRDTPAADVQTRPGRPGDYRSGAARLEHLAVLRLMATEPGA